MKKLGKKLKTSRETIAAYACYCNCYSGCACNCPVWQASYNVSTGIANIPQEFRTYTITNMNSSMYS